jgi:hypothetical protein
MKFPPLTPPKWACARLYLMLGAAVVIVLGNLAWTAWKKRRVSPRP